MGLNNSETWGCSVEERSKMRIYIYVSSVKKSHHVKVKEYFFGVN